MTFPTHRAPHSDGPAGPEGPVPDEELSASTVEATPAGGACDEQDESRSGSRAGGPSGEREDARSGGRDEVPPWETWEIGIRVMVRTRLPEGSSHLYTDLLGTVTARQAGVLTLETRAGAVEVPLASIATGKTVPPAPPRRRPREA